jgi:pimeloyl-ACP methyl ester carboxylesterase
MNLMELLEKIIFFEDLGNLFLYDRPEEIIRFNYEEGKSNCNVNYPEFNIDTHVKNLHKFILNEKINGPLVLVSHSIGALYALKFAQLFPSRIKHVFLIDPIQYTEKIAKTYISKPLSNTEITEHLHIINTPKSSKKIIDKSLQALDSNTYSIPYFKPKLECPLTTFFNVDTKSNVHAKFTLPYLKELKKYNPEMTNYFFYDRDHYLNETNPQGFITKIRKELNPT